MEQTNKHNKRKMSKIFITQIVLLILPITSFPQQRIEIKKLSKNINTDGSEINFVQVSQEKAIYTSFRKSENEAYESSIYETTKNNLKWSKGIYSHRYNLESINTGNYTTSLKTQDVILH